MNCWFVNIESLLRPHAHGHAKFRQYIDDGHLRVETGLGNIIHNTYNREEEQFKHLVKDWMSDEFNISLRRCNRISRFPVMFFSPLCRHWIILNSIMYLYMTAYIIRVLSPDYVCNMKVNLLSITFSSLTVYLLFRKTFLNLSVIRNFTDTFFCSFLPTLDILNFTLTNLGIRFFYSTNCWIKNVEFM